MWRECMHGCVNILFDLLLVVAIDRSACLVFVAVSDEFVADIDVVPPVTYVSVSGIDTSILTNSLPPSLIVLKVTLVPPVILSSKYPGVVSLPLTLTCCVSPDAAAISAIVAKGLEVDGFVEAVKLLCIVCMQGWHL